MIPLARELLRMGSEVVMVANSLPAINDVTCAELRTLLESVCEICPVLKVRLSSEGSFLCIAIACSRSGSRGRHTWHSEQADNVLRALCLPSLHSLWLGEGVDWLSGKHMGGVCPVLGCNGMD